MTKQQLIEIVADEAILALVEHLKKADLSSDMASTALIEIRKRLDGNIVQELINEIKQEEKRLGL